MPSVSVIIPTLKRPAMLQRAIRSVLAQGFQDFEIIVVIDGPDAETVPMLVETLDSRIRVVSLPANVGLAEARNVGIRHARARWVALLDDDDEWLPDKLRLRLRPALQSWRSAHPALLGLLGMHTHKAVPGAPYAER